MIAQIAALCTQYAFDSLPSTSFSLLDSFVVFRGYFLSDIFLIISSSLIVLKEHIFRKMSDLITEVQVFQNFLDNSDIGAHPESSKMKKFKIRVEFRPQQL
jgi:hypothetical protein